ncbi:hypothetical protein DICSQDRAFT_66814 [Dichomitus squalens LYAD-421 SS1]|uniref:ER transporter 6TM N-terminal domain-containing protein n=1 Tax=Dichomitus squalens (strain LYAD-421) TaxID=732165 RepID=R7SR17_DICSQ|nr:uncharacterized protein DICSQDRAFT_66814 [Dichomitus squalens LYAD-421 SS1]EJF58526.1 hypothetical protein DICSQDRAFT_66814 [Dichomitus squalens LYAD-421 SS1]
MGDEEEEVPLPSPRHVRIPEDIRPHSGSSEKPLKSRRRTSPSPRIPIITRIIQILPVDLSWIPPNLTWSKFKPVIRCAVVCWVSALLMIIRRTAALMGTASFLILIAAFLDTPHDPFLAVLEREVIFLTLVCAAWAWSCLGIFLANLARTNIDYFANPADVLAARYVEAGPTIILAVFVFLGSAFFLYLKARMGPGPYIFATVFSCICLDICLTTQVLYPYPFYLIGQAIVIPLAFHCALCIFFAATLFPTTISARYCQTVIGVLGPLNDFLVQHRAVLAQDPSSDQFKNTVKNIQGALRKSEGGLGPAGMTHRLLKQDIVYGRFSPARLTDFQISIRRLVTRADGMVVFFTLIDPTRERFPQTPIPSRPMTPRSSTPLSTRPGTPIVPGSPPNGPRDDLEHVARRRNAHRRGLEPPRMNGNLSRYLHSRLTHHKEEHHDHHLHFSLLSLAHALAPQRGSILSPETAVGVFESQRYMAMEATRFQDRREYTDQFVALLHESCDELLEMSQEVLKGVQTWFAEARSTSFGRRKTVERIRAERLAKLEALSSRVKEVWTRFKKEKRLRVLDPYRRAFDPKHLNVDGPDPPPHRYLFHCFMYQYHLLRFSGILTEILDNIISLEQGCKRSRLWWPNEPFRRILQWGASSTGTDGMNEGDDEDPDVIQGIDAAWAEDLGMTGRRDPDALPPTNVFQWIMHGIHDLLAGLTRGNALFALKAGLLSIILCVPSFLRRTAHFAYAQRFVWGLFMGQLTLARFRGDTTFGLFARIFSTTLGGALGLALWYISAGSGNGNAYGLAAVIGVSSPFLFFWRLYWPVPPMTNIIFFVTAGLVVGFSWQNNHTILPFHYQGWGVAWRRFVLVVCGVVAAFLFSFLPPSTTLRKYQRTMMSTTVAELGAVYCSIVSFANTREHPEVSRAEITQSLVAIRLKLKRSIILKTNIVYEFSLRGRWPSERYQAILDHQLQISNLLSHLMSVLEHLEPAWSRAFLLRTRFLDADFQGDVLAVISMISTALRTGNPLPQITPCPLLDRFMVHTHGLNIIRQEADDDYGLPRTMTIDTLANEQYLRVAFSVGVTTAFGIVLRLDKLMVATKELVGEQYHIHGIGVPEPKSAGPTTPVDRPAKDA